MNEDVKKFNWNENPFTLKIYPQLFVGYPEQVSKLHNVLQNRAKMTLLLGPTGAGKTTLLRWFESKGNSDTGIFYLTKPPARPEDFVVIFKTILKPSLLDRLTSRDKVTIYGLPRYINRKLGKKSLFVLVDESHEAPINVLEWLRTLADQSDNLHVVMAGLPVLEDFLKQNLETLINRVTAKIELTSLTRAETEELIKRRIESSGGSGIKPFTSESIDVVFQRTGGFPRAVLKMCDSLVAEAMKRNMLSVTKDFAVELEEGIKEGVSSSFVETLPEKQNQIIKILSEKDGMTPTELMDRMPTEDYKNEHNAVRSINNILRRLMSDSMIVREKRGKTYVYKLSSKVRTMMITS